VRAKAEECISFWEERGLLERLTAGNREALVFTHAGLGEYAAARYASDCSPEELASWVAEVRRHPRWREVILLAAGLGAMGVVDALLDLYNSKDPVGEELELAALALAEVAKPPDNLVEKVAEAIGERLQADIPGVVFATSESALGLAREVPRSVARVARRLAGHENFATRVAAVRLLLECGPEHADLDVVQNVIEELLEPNEGERDLPQRRNRFIVWRLQDRLVYLGVKQLLELRPGPETEGLVERLVTSSKGLISTGTYYDLLRYLEESGRGQMARRIEGKSRHNSRMNRFVSAEAFIKANRRDIEEDSRFLKILRELTGDVGEVSEALDPTEARELAKLVQGLEFGQYPVGSWEHMVDGADAEAVRAVLAGGIAVFDLDPHRLSREATGAAKYLDQVDPTRGLYRPLYGALPAVPLDPHWDRAADAELAPEDLVRAIAHPSEAVALNAAQLIAHGAGAPEAKELVMGVLKDAPEHAYQAVGILADQVWGDEEAVENLLAALDGVDDTRARYWLLLTLANLRSSKGDARAAETFLDGLKSDDASLATRLAEAMVKAESSVFPLLSALTPRLKEVFEHWSDKTRLPGGEGEGGADVSRSPREALMRLLGDAHLLELEELMDLCSDDDASVKRSAAEQTAIAAARQGVLGDVLENVATGTLPPDVLRETLSLPSEKLRPYKGEITALLASASDTVREQVVGALTTPGWIDPEEATALAEEALKDDDAAVRDRAFGTLRTLREGA
jgi:hypothetical protein